MLESQESVDNSEEKSEEKQETKEPTTPVDITAPSTHDPVRIKCRELLANALKIECKLLYTYVTSVNTFIGCKLSIFKVLFDYILLIFILL